MSMRKDVYERMRYFVVEKIKPNYSAIARQYGVDPRTVKGGFKLSFYGGLKPPLTSSMLATPSTYAGCKKKHAYMLKIYNACFYI